MRAGFDLATIQKFMMRLFSEKKIKLPRAMPKLVKRRKKFLKKKINECPRLFFFTKHWIFCETYEEIYETGC